MPTFIPPRRKAVPGLCLLLAGLLVLAPVAPSTAGELTHLTITRATAANQHLSLGLNKSMIVDLPQDAKEVIVSQPTIAAANMRTKRRVVLEGTGVGETNMFFLDANGVQIATLDVSVVKDSSTLSQALAHILPGSNIDVASFGDHVVLSGTALSQDDVTKAAAIAAQFANGAANVANMITVSGAQQVMLKVTVAEVSRSAVQQLGIELNGSLSVGSVSAGFSNQSALGAASGVVSGTGSMFGGTAIGNGIGAGFSVPGASLDATLHALEQRGLLRKLDEPTLTALSGQSAQFSAGGQIPVVNPPDQSGQVSYSYKQIGVTLNFTPTVKSDGMINVAVDSAVTDVDSTYSVSVAGISIPGLSTREAKTNVELPAGSTLSIGGMFEDKVRQQISQLPGIGNIPILGALFRSRDFIHDQTELVVLVTPYLATPGPQPALPTDGVVAAGDAEAVFLGHMQKLYGVGNPGAAKGRYHGSVGFSLD
ncbi:MAG TPA: type II and III secretion system protein family protein [Devosia sp.]|nr:type II and III secretion system protein family protein [Devosia sp.]